MGHPHIQVESNHGRTTFSVHHFNPDWIREHKSETGPKYDYVVLSHGGDHENPVCVRMFFERDELISLFDQLAPIVAAGRSPAPAAPPAAAGSSETPEVALL